MTEIVKDNYTRYAVITNVVDGDTFDAEVDLGFTVNVNVRFRLRGIDTPEIHKSLSSEEKLRGIAAKERVLQLLKEFGLKVSIKSYKISVYNRWEADVYLNNGKSLAQILISEGHANEPTK